MPAQHFGLMDYFVPWIPWIGCLLAFLCLLGSLRAGSRRRLIDDIPTSKTTGVFIGLVELKGTAEAEQPLVSYLGGQSCVQYAWSIDERWSRTVTETYTDSEGRTQTRTRHESGWTTVDNGGETLDFFYLKDDSGSIRVRPQGAKLECVSVFDETCSPPSALYYGKGPSQAVADSDHVRRFQEQAIPLHHDIYLMGHCQECKDVVAPEIAADKKAPMFLISTRSEEQIRSGFGWAYWGCGIFGLTLCVGGFLAHDLATNQDLARRWPLYLIPAAGYFAAGGMGWLWMVFNSLMDLSQRVRQAWSQVDVQLQRRHDLIPNLVNVIKGLSDHEKNLQTELAEMRAQLIATPPGTPGPDFAACAKHLIAIKERYPELKAQSSYLNLQKNLVDTEQRIALARAYFNDIASFYNARLQIVPDRFVAVLGRLKPQTLMAANDFERAPVDVKFAQ